MSYFAILSKISLARSILLHGVSLVYIANMPKVEILTRKFCRKYLKGKGKVHPRTDHEGPEVKRYSSTFSLSSAPDGVGWSKPHPDRFNPRKDPVPIV
jgi:hypothetical protein